MYTVEFRKIKIPASDSLCYVAEKEFYDGVAFLMSNDTKIDSVNSLVNVMFLPNETSSINGFCS